MNSAIRSRPDDLGRRLVGGQPELFHDEPLDLARLRPEARTGADRAGHLPDGQAGEQLVEAGPVAGDLGGGDGHLVAEAQRERRAVRACGRPPRWPDASGPSARRAVASSVRSARRTAADSWSSRPSAVSVMSAEVAPKWTHAAPGPDRSPSARVIAITSCLSSRSSSSTRSSRTRPVGGGALDRPGRLGRNDPELGLRWARAASTRRVRANRRSREKSARTCRSAVPELDGQIGTGLRGRHAPGLGRSVYRRSGPLSTRPPSAGRTLP